MRYLIIIYKTFLQKIDDANQECHILFEMKRFTNTLNLQKLIW